MRSPLSRLVPLLVLLAACKTDLVQPNQPIGAAAPPHCEGPMRWLEAATTPDAIARLLAKHGLGPRPPPKRPPLGQLWLAFPKT